MTAERGSVLMQVILLTMLACLLACGLLSLRLQASAQTSDQAARLDESLREQAALNTARSVWAQYGSCSSDAVAGLTCSGSGCDCRCQADGARLVSRAVDGTCRLTVREAKQ